MVQIAFFEAVICKVGFHLRDEYSKSAFVENVQQFFNAAGD